MTQIIFFLYFNKYILDIKNIDLSLIFFVIYSNIVLPMKSSDLNVLV